MRSRATLVASIVATVTASQSVIEPLLVSYDSYARPGTEDGQACAASSNATQVVVQFRMYNLHSVDEKKRSYQMDGDMSTTWTDPRLAYGNLSCHDEIVLSNYNAGAKLWVPGVYILEAMKESIGGAGGSMAAMGQSTTITRNGTVSWIRRIRIELLCPTFNWGQLPFDTQRCPIELRSFAYDANEVAVVWPKACDRCGAAPYTTSEWGVTLGSRWTANADGKATARMCIDLQRSSNTYRFTITVAVLLVAAAYCGFFIPAAAAPARVALAFLCFLMVLNNLNAVLARCVAGEPGVLKRLPRRPCPSPAESGPALTCAIAPTNHRLPPLMQPSENYRVWMSDFMWGSMLFNWAALVQYALLCYGVEKQKAVAAKASGAVATPRTSTASEAPTSPSQAKIRPAELPPDAWKAADPSWQDRFDSGMAKLIHLDKVFRWLFPAAYCIFLIVMFSFSGGYETGSCAAGFQELLPLDPP